MSFLNKYTKLGYCPSYQDSIKTGDVIYNVGIIKDTSVNENDIEEVLFVSKMDLNGGLIWSKHYPNNEIRKLKNVSYQIIECSNGDLLLLGVSAGYSGPNADTTKSNLLRIDINGNIIWQKFIVGGKSHTRTQNEYRRLFKIGEEEYIIVFGDVTYNNDVNGNFAIIAMKIDKNGNILVKKRISVRDVIVELVGVNIGIDRIVFYGKLTKQTSFQKGFVLEIDFNLEALLNRLETNEQTGGNISSVFYDNNNDSIILLSIQNNQYIEKINYNGNNLNSIISKINPTPSFGLFYNTSRIFIVNVVHGKSLISKIDYNFNVLWTKSYDHYQNNYLKGIISSVNDKDIIVIDASSSSSLSTISVVGLLNLEFDSCRTSIEANINLEKTESHLVYSKIDYDISDTKFELISLEETIPVIFTDDIEGICPIDLTITEYASIQSGNLYLQSAGSTGEDSTEGIHLRWSFREALSEHLPKGNYATTNHNFNKPNDFVNIFRAKYIPYKILLDFNNAPFQTTEVGSKRYWIYKIEEKVFHVHFRDILKYNQVRNTFNPSTNTLDFIENYGDSLIEIETKNQLSFKITPNFIETSNTNTIRIELLSVLENKITAPKAVSLRKKYSVQEINESELIAENIRCIRFSSTNSYVSSLSFEFYTDMISNNKETSQWDFIDKFALTKEDTLALQRLEPQQGILDNWLRYNDQAYINVENYKKRWNSLDLPQEERIKNAVEKYINLSNALDNPKAIEIIPFNDQQSVDACNLSNPSDDPENPDYDPYIPEGEELNNTTGTVVPYLETLLLGSLDYHVARMLGLGTLDIDSAIFDGQYIYMAEYYSHADLKDGLGVRTVQHLYCSLPTSLQDYRLPVAVDLKEPKPGIFTTNGYNNSEVDPEEEVDEIVDNEQNNFQSVELTQDGYSPDGKTRYYSLFAESIIEEEYNAPFYYIENEFIACESTYPVFAGLEYRKSDTTEWIKPELSHSTEFFNIDTSGISEDLKNETVEIVIPDQGEALYTHAVKESGFLDYSSYGINWFSRATMSEVIHTNIETIIRPTNELLPPTNVNATIIQKESPLFLTTPNEQLLLDAITGDDKTLVRLSFDYNHAQELIDYHQKINGEVIPNYYELHNSKEMFADKIQVYFREEVPNSISGKIKLVNPLSDPFLVEVHTEPYTIYSSGIDESIVPQTTPPTYNETLIPVLQSGTESNYIGSILLVNGISFVIHQIDTSGAYPKFIVFKSDASGSLLNLTSAANPNTEVLTPEVDGLFTVVENMQNETSWNIPSIESFEVNIDLTNVHREDELLITNLDCSTETHVQKFRGIYHDALIEKVLEKVDENQDGSFDIIIDGDSDPSNDQYVEKHLGLYKVTFDGYQLAQHSQFSSTGNSVEWFNGVVRIHTLLSNGARKNFKVVKTKHIGTTNNLILYIQDPTFPLENNELQNYKGKLMGDSENSISQKINYYPGYKVYLYRNDLMNLNKNTVLPQGEEELRYTIFGLRSRDLANEYVYDNTEDYYSKMSIPAIAFANAILEPLQPEKPSGGFYATRPDYFGKSSYTFTTKYGSVTNIHKPYAVQFNRASDIQFLSAIYDNSVLGYDQETQLPILNTVQEVMQNIFQNGEENFYVDRWNNLLNFDYDYSGELPNNPAFPDENGFFRYFEGKRLPMPNNKKFIENINLFIDSHNEFYNNSPAPIQNLNTVIENGIITAVTFGISLNILTLETEIIPQVLNTDGTIRNEQLLYKDFLKDVLLNCFVPLTEIPVIYNYINGGNYKPIPKRQVVRDRNGNMLKPTDDAFDMAPMMKRIDPVGEQYETQFTDFGLDGASNAKYFYAVREINNQLKTSDYSKILGPISLVNTAPPIAPEIIKIIPVLENRVLGINPSIQFQINAYPKAQNIAKVSIYRAKNQADALSIRTMKLVKIIDLEVENLLDESKWIFEDDFSDLVEVPFGDPLYYRLTVSRRIKYNDKDAVTIVDYTPSEASKLIITNIVENYTPESPILNYASDLYNPLTDITMNYITFSWEHNIYKGNYHLYKMNNQGNWVEIVKIIADRIVQGVFQIYNLDLDGNWVNTIHPNPITLINDLIYLPLELTNLANSSLQTKTTDGTPLYHHFKVIAENTAGMMSREERILTIYNGENWQDIGGIEDSGNIGIGIEQMEIENTFIIANNQTEGMIIGSTFIVRES